MSVRRGHAGIDTLEPWRCRFDHSDPGCQGHGNRSPTRRPVADEFGLGSVGLGTRLRLFQRINASLMIAAPLVDREDTKTDFDDRLRGAFRVWAEF